MNTRKHPILAGLLAWLAITTIPAAWGTINQVERSGDPSNASAPSVTARTYFTFSCINILNGDFLDCPFTLELKNLVDPQTVTANNGGHSHDYANHPLGQVYLAPNGGKSRKVTGKTSGGTAVVVHDLPEFSGKTFSVGTMNVPSDKWHCVNVYGHLCYDSQSWRYEIRTNVGLSGLENLSEGADYTKVRNADTLHTSENAYHGTSDTHTTLASIAARYQGYTGNVLSVNDMSLPRGGRFDVLGDWGGAHRLHRVGKSADINRVGVSCNQDEDLLEAVEGNPKTGITRLAKLICESGGRKHIEFD